MTSKAKKAGRVKDKDRITTLVLLAGYPALHRIAERIPTRVNRDETRGRPQLYPTWVMVWANAALAVAGGRNELFRLLEEGYLWTRVRKEAVAAGATDPGETPPKPEHLRHWRTTFSHQHTWDELAAVFREESIQDARALGNFDPDVSRDLTRLTSRNTITGDGTHVRSFTSTGTITDPETGEEHINGYTDHVQRLRTQRSLTENPDPDKRKEQTRKGLNFVVFQTVTAHGPVVLGVEYALRHESLTAYPMMKQLCRDIGAGLLAISYDRGVYGWPQPALGHHYGVWLLSTRKAAKSGEADADRVRKQQRDHLADIMRAAAEGTDTGGIKPDETLVEIRAQRVLARDYTRFTELGHSEYQEDSGKVRQVTSIYRHLETISHKVNRAVCRHDLWVDDGVLVEADPESRFKVAVPRMLESMLRPDPSGGHHAHARWLVPCENGAFEYEKAWPLDGRGASPEPGIERSEADLALTELQLVGRGQDAFQTHSADRNAAEGLNAWLKTFLPSADRQSRRARSLHAGAQRLDLLGMGLQRNALTWQQHLRSS